MEEVKERVILVGIQLRETDTDFAYTMQELDNLTQTAGGKVVATLIQKREKFDSKTALGKGKMEELVRLVDELNATTLIFQNELSPSHVRNIQELIDCKVIDRIQLILDIFALRATSREGKLQVKLAQLNYSLPRLAGVGKNMSRLGAGIGTRGPGETKLESDRRRVRDAIHDAQEELKYVEKHRQRVREKRKNSGVFQIGLIGYTNAGKSTLINRLANAGTYEQDQLFATLDPLTRQFKLKNQYPVTITDTVGFIQDIPTQLIHAFKSTLEESSDVDLLLHVVDSSAENYETHQEVVMQILEDLDMTHIPMLTVYNKKDLSNRSFVPTMQPSVYISALDLNDMDTLNDVIWRVMTQEILESYNVQLKLGQEELVAELKATTFVVESDFDTDTLLYRLSGYSKSDAPVLKRLKEINGI